MKKLFFPLALFAASLGTVSSTRAATKNWNNTGTDFNAGASWTGSVAPGPADMATFATAASTQPNLSSSLTIGQLSFSTAVSSGYTLSATPGAALTLLVSGTTGSTTAITVSATSGFDLISAPIVLGAASGVQSITVATGGVLAITGPISSTADVTLRKNGTLFLLGANTYTGSTTMLTGPLVINSIGNVGGGASSLGAPTTAANGTIGFGGNSSAILQYVGGATTTDRNILFDASIANTTRNYFVLDASGSGALAWTGNMTVSGSTSSTYTNNLWLGGINEGNNTFSGSILQNTTGGPATTLSKNGLGTWVLSGSSNFTGGLNVGGGTLVLDYEHGAVVDSSNILHFGGGASPDTGYNYQGIPNPVSSAGTLKLVGKSSGSTAQTFGAVSFTQGQNNILIDPNGGLGTTLATGAWTINDNYNGLKATVYLDLPSGAKVSSTNFGALTGSLIAAGKVLINDGTGVGFATTDTGLVSGNAVKYTGATALSGTSTAFLNYKYAGGSLNMSAAARTFNSLSVDTTVSGTLDLGGNAAVTVTSLLFTGTGNYLVTNGVNSGTMYNVHQYSTGVVTIDSISSGTATGATYFAKDGAGTLAVNTRGGNRDWYILGGALRANGSTVVSAGNTVLNGGVLELGSDNFTASLGAAGTVNTIRFLGDGGFSAFGGDKTVQIGGSTASIAWGTTANFLPNDNALVLSSKDSDSTIDFQNGLGLGTQQHVVHVDNGSAAVDAKLSGVLSGNYGGGLVKEGAGTLSITGNSNTYIGETWVNAGTLLVNGNQSAATGAVRVAAGATLGGTGTIGGATTISGTHSPGNSPGIQTFASDLTYTSGAAVNWELKSNTTTNAANPNAIFDTIVVNGNLTFSGSTSLNLSFVPAGSDVLWSDGFWFTNHLGTNGWLLYDVAGTLTGFGNLNLVTSNWLDSGGNHFDTSLYPGAGFTLFQSGNDIYLNYAIPEPSTWLLMAFGVTAVIVFRRRMSVR